jgi:hypothetical protein
MSFAGRLRQGVAKGRQGVGRIRKVAGAGASKVASARASAGRHRFRVVFESVGTSPTDGIPGGFGDRWEGFDHGPCPAVL